jgi:osmotically-inducible protein OsmY
MDAAPGRLAITSGREASEHGEGPGQTWNEAAMRDDDLRHDVAAELAWDPQVGSEAIEVLTASGVVTLRGTVANLRLKRAASEAAERVRGVTRVANELRVRIPNRDRRDDEDLRGDVLEALMLDVSVPMTVGAHARDGLVTLTGTARWHYQREAAEFRTANVPGVVGVDNAIILARTSGAYVVRDAISGAFRRNAVLKADVVTVETSRKGLVILSGTVSSSAARDHAVAAAWSAPGVTQVDDRIRVDSEQ